MASDRLAMLGEFRRQFPEYSDMPDDELGAALAKQYPDAYGDLAPGAPGLARIVGRNIAKIPERAAADVMGAIESFRNPSMAATLPLAVPGAGVATRIGTAAMGRMLDQPSTSPMENLKTAGKAATFAGLAEAAVPLLSRLHVPFVGSARGAAGRLANEQQKVLEENARRIVAAGRQTEARARRAAEQTAAREAKVAAKTTAEAQKAQSKTERREQAFQWATTAPKRAIDAIAPTIRVVKPVVLIPSVNASKPIPLSEAAEALGNKRGADYEQTLSELVRELNRLSPRTGDLFKAHVAESIFPPRAVVPRAVPTVVPVVPRPVAAPELAEVPRGTAFERAATRTLPALENPALRAALDTGAANLPPGAEMALAGGAIGAAEGIGGLYDLVRHAPRMLK